MPSRKEHVAAYPRGIKFIVMFRGPFHINPMPCVHVYGTATQSMHACTVCLRIPRNKITGRFGIDSMTRGVDSPPGQEDQRR